MSQGPPQRPGEESEGTDHPTERFEPTQADHPTERFETSQADHPTQAFGSGQAEQPTQAFDQPAAGTPAGQSPDGQPGQAGQPPPGGAEQIQYGPPHQHGDSQGPQRQSPVLVAIGILVALLVVGGLVFAGINFFSGDDDTPAGPEQTEPVDAGPPADVEEESAPEQTRQDAEAEDGAAEDETPQDEAGTDPQETDDPASEPDGELYDLLTESASQVEGIASSWTIEEPGWTIFNGEELADVSEADLLEAYTATFTSADDESLTMWATMLDDPQAGTDWAERLVEQRGESDRSGPVWDEEQSEDELVWGEGVFHEWEDGDDVEILWWDDRGVVRYVTGPTEVTRDFYLYFPL